MTVIPRLRKIAEFLKASYRAIRVSSVLCFTSATIVGAVLAGSLINLRTVWLITFSLFSAAFAFVINDLSDAELDRSAGVLRNPVSTGDLSLRGGISLTFLLLLVSVAALLSLSLQSQLLGLVVISIYFTYSWGVRAKARPVFDIAYHGLGPAIFATIGYIEYRPFDVTCFFLASLVFLLSAISQILQEVRDYETDRKMVKTTVTLLGKKLSLILCLVFFVFAFVLLFLLLFYGVVPFSILLMSPLAYFIVAPIIRAIVNEEYENRMLRDIKEKRLILIAILIVALILEV